MSLNTPPLGRTQRDYGRSGLDGGGGADAQPVFSAPRDIKDDLEKIYANNVFDESNWYTQKPYGFVFTDRKGRSSTFYLPISPSNMSITTHFATNVISTMYGTVEEHSEQRYYDIQIAGTTGMSPRYYDTIENQYGDGNGGVIGRAGYPVKGLIPGGAGGFARRTQALVESALNNAADIFGSDRGSTGVDTSRTGYVAFHNFYRWLLNYKKDASGESGSSRTRGRHPLQFINFKDNNQYDVAVQGFSLTKDAANPMLYNYNLVLRAYNLRGADAVDISLDIQDRSEALGLDGLESSLFAKMATKARQAKNAGYSAIAAAKGFGS